MLLEITIASNLSFQKYGLSQGIVRSISKRFTYENPVYIKNERLGKRNFGVPRFSELLSESPDSYHLPRGCIGQLSELLDLSGCGLRRSSSR